MMRFTRLFIIFAVLLASIAIAPDRFALGQGQTTPGGNPFFKVFMPLLAGQPAYSVSGQVKDASGKPMGNVQLVGQDGRLAATDGSGNYKLGGMPAGSYAVAPAKQGYVFSPSMSGATLPAASGPLNFDAYQACSDAVINGSFETTAGWQLPVTMYTANYSTVGAHTGSYSMRTGIVDPADNTYSYSSARQPIKIPKGTTSAVLKLWAYTLSTETTNLAIPSMPTGPEVDTEALGSDAQYMLVLDTGRDPYDPNEGSLLETLLWTRRNDQQWVFYQFDLTKYASSTQDVWIKIQAGTYNDGAGGVTSMYVDDVVLELCDAGTVPPPPPPPTTGCNNAFLNSGFESASLGWSIPVTAYSARYSSAQVYGGAQSMRTGIVDASKNVFSYSDAWQLAPIPSAADSATLNMRIYQVSTGSLDVAEALPDRPVEGQRFSDLAPTSDVSYVLVLNQYGYILETLFWERSNAQAWTPLSFDLSKYAGRTIRIQFGTYNNGTTGVSAMFVDDATLDVCTGVTPTPTPPPTATPPPGTCIEGFENNSFEAVSDWDIPITAFSANYSSAQAHTGVQSMRTGIVHTYHNRFSYSDAYQVATIPVSSDSSTLGMWIYPVSSEVVGEALPDKPTAALKPSAALAGDVQYVLILDRYGNWIDTLLWQRVDDQAWTYFQADLSDYIGATIRLQFGVYNDGVGGITSMYVDDVTLQNCP